MRLNFGAGNLPIRSLIMKRSLLKLRFMEEERLEKPYGITKIYEQSLKMK